MALRIPPGLGRTILFKNDLGELQPPSEEYDYVNHKTWINENGSNPESKVSEYPDFMKKLASVEPGKFEMEIVLDEVATPTIVRQNAFVKLLSSIFSWATRMTPLPQSLEPKIEKATYGGIVQEDTSVPGGSPYFMFKTSDGKTHWIHISTMYQRLM